MCVCILGGEEGERKKNKVCVCVLMSVCVTMLLFDITHVCTIVNRIYKKQISNQTNKRQKKKKKTT
jgi:hypothetical protein